VFRSLVDQLRGSTTITGAGGCIGALGAVFSVAVGDGAGE
jgi:hypothetical protein